MINLAFVLLATCGAAIVSTWWVTRQFAVEFTKQRPKVSDDDLPRVAVIMPLRGADPFLEQCLRGLLKQNYPRFEVRIVLDGATDPARQIVDRVLSDDQQDHLHVDVLCNPRATCGLKVSAIQQAIDQLDDSVEAIAILDADGSPHENWLRELASALCDSTVGAATGIRWFAPPTRASGTLVRHQWNILANIQMHAAGIPWGGSLAIHRKVFEDPDHRLRWTKSLCEDTPLAQSLRQLDLRLVLVPEAVFLNRESIHLAGAFHFIRRQLLLVRLHHPRWWFISLLGFIGLLTPMACLGLTLALAASGEIPAAVACGLAPIAYVATVVLSVKRASRCVRQTLAKRGEEIPRGGIDVTTVVYACLSLFLHGIAVLLAIVTRQITWRGIAYRIGHRGQIQMVEYSPFIMLPTTHETADTSI
ncbi:MAG: glycosyltransferase family 2 protein [Planctomycetota bacterium]|nr:glycosyltransferase family 2 protein [Planctomycetota bacterium]